VELTARHALTAELARSTSPTKSAHPVRPDGTEHHHYGPAPSEALLFAMPVTDGTLAADDEFPEDGGILHLTHGRDIEALQTIPGGIHPSSERPLSLELIVAQHAVRQWKSANIVQCEDSLVDLPKDTAAGAIKVVPGGRHAATVSGVYDAFRRHGVHD
jgi:hypothetical protein